MTSLLIIVDEVINIYQTKSININIYRVGVSGVYWALVDVTLEDCSVAY